MSKMVSRLLGTFALGLALVGCQENLPPEVPQGPAAAPEAQLAIDPELALVPADVSFATVRPAALLAVPGGKELVATWSDFGPDEVQRREAGLGRKLDGISRVTMVGSGPDLTTYMHGYRHLDGYIIVTATTALDQSKFLARPSDFDEGMQAAEHNGKKYYVRPEKNKGFGPAEDTAIYFHDDRTVVFGFVKGVKKAIDQAVKPNTTGPTAKAVADAGRQLLAFGAPGHDPARPLPADLPTEQADLGSVRQWLIVGRVGEKGLELDLHGTFPNEKSAGGAAKALADAKARKALCPGASAPATATLESLTIRKNGPEVILSTGPAQGKDAVPAALAGLFEVVKADPADKPHEMVNLLRLGRCFSPRHAFDSAQRVVFAQQQPGARPVAMHSWRVAYLPQLGEEALYKQIRLNEPWDSEHNKQFHNRMPKVFEVPGRAAPAGQTYYQVFVGPGAIFSDDRVNRYLGHLTDGASNTLLIAEAATAVNWMEPKEISFEVQPAGFPNARLGDPKADRFLVAFGDGLVRRLSRKITPQNLQALITSDGKEPWALD